MDVPVSFDAFGLSVSPHSFRLVSFLSWFCGSPLHCTLVFSMLVIGPAWFVVWDNLRDKEKKSTNKALDNFIYQ